MKKTDVFLKEYLSRLSTDTLRFLSVRLDNRIGPDIAEVLETISTCNDVDKWLLSSKSSDELYDMIDLFQEYVDRELGKRAPELVGA